VILLFEQCSTASGVHIWTVSLPKSHTVHLLHRSNSNQSIICFLLNENLLFIWHSQTPNKVTILSAPSYASWHSPHLVPYPDTSDTSKILPFYAKILLLRVPYLRFCPVSNSVPQLTLPVPVHHKDTRGTSTRYRSHMRCYSWMS
jgi:hypothetical protein